MIVGPVRETGIGSPKASRSEGIPGMADAAARWPAFAFDIGFDLVSRREARIRRRCRRTRISWVLVVIAGCAGAALLQKWARMTQDTSTNRLTALSDRLHAFAPDLAEHGRLTEIVAAARAHEFRLAQLAPRRLLALRWMAVLAESVPDHIAITGTAIARDADNGALATVDGLAEDGDQLSHWVGKLKAYPDVLQVRIERLRRQEFGDKTRRATLLNDDAAHRTSTAVSAEPLPAGEALAGAPVAPSDPRQPLHRFHLVVRMSLDANADAAGAVAAPVAPRPHASTAPSMAVPVR